MKKFLDLIFHFFLTVTSERLSVPKQVSDIQVHFSAINSCVVHSSLITRGEKKLSNLVFFIIGHPLTCIHYTSSFKPFSELVKCLVRTALWKK